MSSLKNIKSLGSLFAAILILGTILAGALPLTSIGAHLFNQKASAACAGGKNIDTGSLVVTLSKTPPSAAKVTITRAEDVPADQSCDNKVHPAETLTLSGGCAGGVRRCSNAIYSSSALPYSGFSGAPDGCKNYSYQSYYAWQIKVSGSAIGSDQVIVSCGTQVNKTVDVVLASEKSKYGTIAGTAVYKNGEVCIPTSQYNLDPAGKGSSGEDAKTSFPVDKNGNYSITGIKPGTYDLVLRCDYGSDVGARQNYEYLKQNITVTGGKTTTVNFTTDDPSGGGPQQQDTPSCETTGFGLAWIMCRIIDGLADAVNGIYDGLVQPMLNTPGIGPTSSVGVPLKKAWSSFRVLADILLVIALLVVVFGESIGGGMIDAYTVKKVLPRLLIAAVLINISFYLMEAAIDISNIIGRGLGGLITAPFGLTNGAGHFKFDLNGNGAVQESASLITFAGATGAAAIAATFAGIAVASAGIGATLSFLFFFVLLPAIIIILAIVATLIIRVGLIYALVLAAPLAFAAYVLPNTEKYFKKWWEVLQELLMVYPIIAVLFALSQVLAQTSLWANANGSGVQQAFAFIASLIILLIPLAAIPFAFKLAGGLIGRVHELVHTGGQRFRGAINGNDKDPNSRRNRARTKMQLASVQGRQERYQALQDRIDKSGSRVGRRLLRARAGMMGGYNIEAAASAARAQVGKELNDQIATGKDEEIRGLSVNKKWAMSQAAFGDWVTKDGKTTRTNGQVLETQNADGSISRQFKSLGGAWINESDVDAGHARWGKNTFAQQASLAYEMRKAQSEEQLDNLAQNYHHVATGAGGWGNTEQQAAGSWIGASFEHQNAHLENKYKDWQSGQLKRDDKGVLGAGFVDEIYEKRGSYPLAQMGSKTIEQLQFAHSDAQRTIDSATATAEQKAAAISQQEKIAAVAETFMHQYGGDPNDPATIAAANAAQQAGTPAGRAATRQANTPGAAHVAERVRQLAVQTGVYTQAPGPRAAGPTRPGDPYNSQNPQS